MALKWKNCTARKKAILIVVILAALILSATLLYIPCWKCLVSWRIESLNLPEGSVEVYPVKAWLSDVYWPHIKAEKVLDCEMGTEAAKEYIETHNPAWKLKNIEIVGYSAMSDTAIYELDYDEEYARNWNTDHCVHIVYFKKVFEWW